MKPGRIPCLVPFCRRTGKREPGHSEDVELLCGKHWRLADKWLRRRFGRLERLLQRGVQGSARDKATRLYFAHWDRIKGQAITRAMGA